MNARLMQAQREEMAAVQLVLARARAADQHAERLALLREEAERRRAGAPSSEIPPVDVRSPPRASAAADATVSRLQVEMTNLRARMAAPSREDRAEEQAAADSVAKIRRERREMTQQLTHEALSVMDARWEQEQRQINAEVEARRAAKAEAARAAAEEAARKRAEEEARQAAAAAEEERRRREKMLAAKKAAAAYLFKANSAVKLFVGNRDIERRSNEEQRRDARIGSVLARLRRTRAVGLSTKLLDLMRSRHPSRTSEAKLYAAYAARMERLEALIAAQAADEDADPEPLLSEAVEAGEHELGPNARLTAALALELQKLRAMPKAQRYARAKRAPGAPGAQHQLQPHLVQQPGLQQSGSAGPEAMTALVAGAPGAALNKNTHVAWAAVEAAS